MFSVVKWCNFLASRLSAIWFFTEIVLKYICFMNKSELKSSCICRVKRITSSEGMGCEFGIYVHDTEGFTCESVIIHSEDGWKTKKQIYAC